MARLYSRNSRDEKEKAHIQLRNHVQVARNQAMLKVITYTDNRNDLKPLGFENLEAAVINVVNDLKEHTNALYSEFHKIFPPRTEKMN